MTPVTYGSSSSFYGRLLFVTEQTRFDSTRPPYHLSPAFRLAQTAYSHPACTVGTTAVRSNIQFTYRPTCSCCTL